MAQLLSPSFRLVAGHRAAVHKLRWSPQGDRLLVVDGDGATSLSEGQFVTWPAMVRGRNPRAMETAWIHDAAFSPDESQVVLASYDRLTCLDVSSQEVTWTFEKSRWTGLRYSTFLCVVSLHDGTFLCGSADGEVVVLDREGKVLREALSHEGPTSLAQSADGTLFGSDGYGLTKWDPESLTSEVLLPDVRIYSLACLGERVIFRSDCEVWAWSRSEVIRKRIPPGPPSLATSSAFGGLILVIDGEDIAALNPNLEVVSEFRVGDRTPVCLQVDGGDQLAIGYRDGSVDLVSLSQIM